MTICGYGGHRALRTMCPGWQILSLAPLASPKLYCRVPLEELATRLAEALHQQAAQSAIAKQILFRYISVFFHFLRLCPDRFRPCSGKCEGQHSSCLYKSVFHILMRALIHSSSRKPLTPSQGEKSNGSRARSLWWLAANVAALTWYAEVRIMRAMSWTVVA